MLQGRDPLVTVRDAATYIIKLPIVERELPQWKIAIEWLMLVGEHGGDPMAPRIAMMKALRRHEPLPLARSAPRRKRAKSLQAHSMMPSVLSAPRQWPRCSEHHAHRPCRTNAPRGRAVALQCCFAPTSNRVAYVLAPSLSIFVGMNPRSGGDLSLHREFDHVYGNRPASYPQSPRPGAYLRRPLCGT